MVLSETIWNEISGKISDAFRLDENEAGKLKENNVAKLIAAIPFNSECENMERTALAHLGTYMLAKDNQCKDFFGHTVEDNADVLKRMQLGNHFQGGDRNIIDRGMNLLALIQLEDHKTDLEEDLEAGKYNPIASGAWNYEETKEYLLSSIKAVESQEMDAVMDPDSVKGYWDGL